METISRRSYNLLSRSHIRKNQSWKNTFQTETTSESKKRCTFSARSFFKIIYGTSIDIQSRSHFLSVFSVASYPYLSRWFPVYSFAYGSKPMYLFRSRSSGSAIRSRCRRCFMQPTKLAHGYLMNRIALALSSFHSNGFTSSSLWSGNHFCSVHSLQASRSEPSRS